MTYRLPEDIKHAINTMRDHYPYIRPNRKWKAYKYNRKKFRKHGFWSSVCWDLDWAVILYLTAAVSLDSPTATDADGDSILATLKSIIARENAWFDFDNNVPVEAEKEAIIIAFDNNTYRLTMFDCHEEETKTFDTYQKLINYADRWFTNKTKED